ncbi:hypothetical protein, partial [Corynebacterium variabile]
MANTIEAPDLTYGFVLSTHCDAETLSRELTAGRLAHHSTLGDIEVYRDPDNFTAMHVDDYFPTVMALGLCVVNSLAAVGTPDSDSADSCFSALRTPRHTARHSIIGGDLTTTLTTPVGTPRRPPP